MSPSCCPRSMRSRRSAAGWAVPAASPTHCSPTRLRPRHLPRPGPRPRHRARHGPPRHTTRHRTGRLSLGDRAQLCLAARLPTAADPLGTTSRHARSVPQTRLLPHHPPTTRLIVLAVVSRFRRACTRPRYGAVAHLVLRPYSRLTVHSFTPAAAGVSLHGHFHSEKFLRIAERNLFLVFAWQIDSAEPVGLLLYVRERVVGCEHYSIHAYVLQQEIE